MPERDSPLSLLPPHDRPRERLGRLGPAALSDRELLALVLGSGSHGRNVIATAGDILDRVGGFRGLLPMTSEELQGMPGVGPATAGRMAAAAEMWRRAAVPSVSKKLSDSASIAHVALPLLMHRRTEQFLLLATDRALRLLDTVVISGGSEARADVDVSEVLTRVFTLRGHAFAVAHNHPGGSLEPSAADTAATEQLRTAAGAVGLRFLDHLIVAGADWRSIA